MKYTAIGISVLWMACTGSDKNVGFINQAPTVQITSHADGAELPEDTPITFMGNVSDLDHSADELLVTWYAGTDILCAETAPGIDGVSVCEASVSAGVQSIRLSARDPFNERGEDSISVEVQENSTPQVSITEPLASGTYYTDELITFSGTVSDAEDDAEDLRTYWKSSIDGVLSVDATPNGDGLISGYGNLSEGQHVIELHVEDSEGKTNKASVIIEVGAPNTFPPSLVISEPLDGAVYNQGANITFVAEVSDAEDAPEQIAISWKSSLDDVFSTQGADSTGRAQFSTNSLRAGAHSITVTATDTSGQFSQELFDITINGIPTQPTIAISPDPAYTNNVLTVSASGSIDPEGSAVSYAYAWLQGGATTSYTSSTVPSSATSKGEVWTVRVTPNDGQSNGPFAEASITISNTAPVVQTVGITPNNPSTQSNLVCSYTASDDDGDAVSVGYAWSMGANTLSSTSNTLNGPFQVGDIITCTVTPFDGSDYGVAVSESVTINNTPPSIQSVSLSPSVVFTNDVLTATVSASDNENDPLSYSWEWYVDSGNGFSVVQSNSGTYTTDTLDGVFHFDKGDDVYVRVTVSDTSTSTSQDSSSTTVQNTAPSIFNVVIDPADPVAGADDLRCIAQESDADGDSVVVSFAWNIDGVLSNYTSDTISRADIADGEVWECVATPNDGSVDGASASISVTVGADLPEATGGSICAAAGVVTDANGHQFFGCLAETGVAGSGGVDALSNTWQPGSIFIFSPE